MVLYRILWKFDLHVLWKFMVLYNRFAMKIMENYTKNRDTLYRYAENYGTLIYYGKSVALR